MNSQTKRGNRSAMNRKLRMDIREAHHCSPIMKFIDDLWSGCNNRNSVVLYQHKLRIHEGIF